MSTKLTLKIDEVVIRRAKDYAAKEHSSVSRLVEDYLRRLTYMADPPRLEPTGVVAELSGVMKGLKVTDHKEEYGNYIVEKYQ